MILLSIIAFSLVGRQEPLVMVGSRIAADPGHRGASATRSSGSARATAANPLVKVLLYPGLLVQMITTKQPTDDMIEVAIVSMEQALEADGEHGPGRLGRLPARAARPRTSRRRPRPRSRRRSTDAPTHPPAPTIDPPPGS